MSVFHHTPLTEILAPHAIESNMQALANARVFLAIVSGITSGILGLAGWNGFVSLIVIEFIFFAFIFASKLNSKKMIFPSIFGMLFSNVFQNVMTFVLFWATSYNIVHIY